MYNRPLLKQSNLSAKMAHTGEKSNGKSLTVPDMSMSIMELQMRFTQGRPVPQFRPEYSEFDRPDLEAMDLTEVAELYERVQERQKERKEYLKQVQQARTAKEKQIEAWHKAQAEQQATPKTS